MPVWILDAIIHAAVLNPTDACVGVFPLEALDLLSEGRKVGRLLAHSPALLSRRAFLSGSCIVCSCARGRAGL